MTIRIIRIFTSISIAVFSCLLIIGLARSTAPQPEPVAAMVPQFSQTIHPQVTIPPIATPITGTITDIADDIHLIPQVTYLTTTEITNTDGENKVPNVDQTAVVAQNPVAHQLNSTASKTTIIDEEASTQFTENRQTQITLYPAATSSDLLTVTAPVTITIFGPNVGFSNKFLHFTATVEPITTTIPLTYRWQTVTHGATQHTNTISDTMDFIWLPPGNHQISVTVSNLDGAVSDTFTTTILEEPITGLIASTNSPISIGSPMQFTATILSGSNISYTWGFGDLSTGFGANTSHTYAAPGTYSVTLRAENTVSIVTTTLWTVVKEIPLINLSNFSYPEGSLFSVKGTFTDSDSTTWTGTTDFGDGSGLKSLSINADRSFTLTHTYLDSGIFTVTVHIFDEINGMGSLTVTATITNVAPTANLTSTSQVNEGHSATMTFTNQLDPSTIDTASGFIYGYDFNNDWIYEITGTPHATATVPAIYLQDGPLTQTVHAKIEDLDGGINVYTSSIFIQNMTPILANLSAADLNEGDFAVLTGDIIDPGILDIFTMTVDWGEGAPDIYFFNAGASSFSINHQYLDDNPMITISDTYTISLGIEDSNQGSSTASKNLVVKNVAPTFTNLLATDIFENGYTTLTGSIVDPGIQDPITLTINWGDGASQVYAFTAGTTGFSKTHQYLDDNPSNSGFDTQLISLAVEDDDNGITNDNTSLKITNKNPILTNLVATNINETGTTTLTGNISDVGTLDSFILSITWENSVTEVFTYPAGTTSFTKTHQYLDDNPTGTQTDSQLISVKLEDDDLGSNIQSTSIIITNIAPTLISLSGTNTDENGISTLSGVFSDTSILDTFILTVTWGDSTQDIFTYPAGTTQFTETHRYLDDNLTDSFTISTKLSDDDLGSALGSTNVSVANLAPSLENILITSQVVENSQATLSGKIVDPGTLDTFILTVNWGDGSPSSTYPYPSGTTTFSVKHLYNDDNPTGTISDTYAVNFSVIDDDGGLATGSTSLIVTNADPVLSSVLIDPWINENGVATLTGLITDPGSQDTFVLTVNWGDGTVKTYPYAAASSSFTVTHQYLDDNPSNTSEDVYTVNLSIEDDDKGSDSTVTNLSVRNVNPTLSSFTINNVNENGVATLTGQISDPGMKDPFTITIQWGDGSGNDVFLLAANSTSFNKSHTYLDDNPSQTAADDYSITIIAEDDDLGVGSISKKITVTNLKPTITGLTATNTVENGYTTLSGTIVDVGTLDSFTMTVNWGDSLSDVYTFTAGNRVFNKTHKYLDDNPTKTASDPYTISITLVDDDLGSNNYSTNLTVANVVPQISSLSATPISENQITTLTGIISDPGTLDSFTLSINWGDSTTSSHSFSSASLVNGSFPFTMTHQFLDDTPSNTSSDIATIKVTITDDDLGSSSANVSQYISNTAPIFSLINITPVIYENDSATLIAKIIDPGILDTFNVTVNWGDSTSTTTPFPAGTTNITLTHQYLDDNPTGTSSDIYTVNLSVIDDDLGQGTGSTSLRVFNAKPSLTSLLASSVFENEVSTLTGQIVDQGTKDTFRLIVAWGDGKSDTYSFPVGTKTFTKTHRYLDDNPTGSQSDPHTILIVVYDDDGGQNTGSANLVVTNIAPVLSGLYATNVDENGTSMLSGSITDPGSEDTFSLAIGWGDGVTDLIAYPAGTTTFTATHKYLDDNPSGTMADNYSISIIALDDDNGVTSSSTINQVNNLNPVLSNLAITNVSEHNLANLTGSISDIGSLDTFTLTVNWGDSSSDQYGFAAGTTLFARTHRYLDNGIYTVTATLNDDDNGLATGQITTTVTNIQPILNGVSATDISENSFTTLSGMIVDPGTMDTFTVTVAWGDGTSSDHSLPAGSTMFAITHKYLDDNPGGTPSDKYDISVEITDKDLGKGVASTNLIVSNTSPSITNLTAKNINENSSTTLSGTIVDPGTLDTFTMTVSWGDGSSDTHFLPAGTSGFTLTHTYLDDNPTATSIDNYTITVTIQDDDTGQGTKNTTFTVSNVNPSLSNLLITPSLQENGIATLTGVISDTSLLDTFSLQVDWGDGSPIESFSGFTPGSAVFTQTHRYKDDSPSGTAADLYTINVTVYDDDTGSHSSMASLIIHNAVPQISNLNLTSSIFENDTATLSGSILDVGTQDSYTLTIDWGDGVKIDYSLPVGSTSFLKTHTYLDDNPSGTASDEYTVLVALEDDDLGNATLATRTITVQNVSPTVTNLAFSNISENSYAILSGKIIDPGTKDPLSLQIRWGDGVTDTYTLAAGTTTFSKTHLYTDDNPTGTSSDIYTAYLKIQDDDLGQSTGQASMTVSNTPPFVTDLAASSISENGTSSLTGKFNDPGAFDTFNLFVNWGDGSSASYNLPAGSTSFTQTHQYKDDNPSGSSVDQYSITITMTDDDLGQVITTTKIIVSNTDPTITSLLADSTVENGITTLLGSFIDPGTLDTFNLTVDWGDGVTNTYPLIAGSTTFSQTHLYFDDNPTGTTADTYTITVSLEDDDKGSDTAFDTITVSNVSPIIQNLSSTNVDENGFTTLSGIIIDPGTQDTFAALISWGDGTSNLVTLNAGTTNFSKTHQYQDDNPSVTSSDIYTIQVSVKDDDNEQATASTTVVVSNVAPQLTDIFIHAVNENETTNLTAKIIDPGSEDTFTIKVNWGDGSIEVFNYLAGTTIFTETHRYLDDDPGGTSFDLYTVSLEIMDDDSGLNKYTSSLTVTNQAPSLLSMTAVDVNEAEFTTLKGQFFDPGIRDSFTLTVDWGDGQTDTYANSFTDIAGMGGFTQTHIYTDDNPTATNSDIYSITVNLLDDDLGSVSQLITITVSNVNPIISIPFINPVKEGSSFNIVGSISDPGSDTWKAIVGYGDGLGSWSLPVNQNKQFTMNWVYDDNGAKVLEAIVHDDDLGTGVITQTVAVENVAPTAVFTGTTEVSEGTSGRVWFAETFDPSLADTQSGFHYSYDFNLDGFFDVISSPSFSATIPAYILANGPEIVLIKGRIEDKDHGFTDYILKVSVLDAAPISHYDVFSVLEDSTLSIVSPGLLLNDTDVPADILSVHVYTQTRFGSISVFHDGSFVYKPGLNFNGSDTFAYKARSGQLISSNTPVTITVIPVNDAPITIVDTFTISEDTFLRVDALHGVINNDIDIEKDPITAKLVKSTSSGSLALNSDGSFVYTPAQSFFGIDTFTYQAFDGFDLSIPTQVTITITSLPNEPIAHDDYFTIFQAEQLVTAAPGVLKNDQGGKSPVLSAMLTSQPLHGDLLFMPDGGFKYTSDREFVGEDTFTYSARDEFGNISNSATVHIQVNRKPEDLYSLDYLLVMSPVLPQSGVNTNIALSVIRSGGSVVLDNIVDVTFYLNSPDPSNIIGVATVGNLQPDSINRSNSITWKPTAPGNYLLYAVIDSSNKVVEQDETNNVIVRQISVMPPPNPGDHTSPIVNLFKINLGAATTENLDVSLYLSASDVGSRVTKTIFAEFVYSQTINTWVPVYTSDWMPFSGSSSTYSWKIDTTPGAHYLISWVSDQYGNISAPYMTHINYNPSTIMLEQNQVSIYRLALQAGQTITATLTSISGDADIYAFSPVHIDGNRVLVGASYSTGSEDKIVIHAAETGIFQLEIEGYSAAQYSLTLQIAGKSSADQFAPFGIELTPVLPKSKARSIPINSGDPAIDYSIPAPYKFNLIFIPIVVR